MISPSKTLSALFILWLPCGALQAAEPALTGPIPFESFDSNNDNMISPQEYVETHNLRKKLREKAGMPMKRNPTPGFTDFDSNGDNLISREELEAGRQAMGRGGQGMGRGMGMGQGMGPGMGMGKGMGRNMPSFSDFDLNGDGVLLKEEFYDARAKRMYDRAEQGYPLRNAANAPDFETVDSNGDGKISEQEFREHQRQHRMMMQQ
jgi:Ca2+-binding EF-hand superfamily protein